MTAKARIPVENSPLTASALRDARQKIIPITSLRTAQEQREEFTSLLTAQHRDLLVYARAIVFDTEQARDLVQESCLTAWANYGTYDPDRADFGAWVRGILRNKARDWSKSKRGGQRPEVSIDAAHLDFLDHSLAPLVSHARPWTERLRTCLDKLPQELREPILLTYYQGHSGQEASENIGIRHATLRKRLSRARTALYTCIVK